MLLFIASIIMTIPPLMIALSVLLKPKINRLLNIIFGILFTLMMVLIAIGSLTPWYIFYVFLAIVEALLTFMVVWNAWKWPQNEVN
jgi:TRAP-type C4-dicarboxylate transport system permease small subunit